MARLAAIFGIVLLTLLFAGAAPLYAQTGPNFVLPSYGAEPRIGGPMQADLRGGYSAPPPYRHNPSERAVMEAIWDASQHTGMDFQYLLAQAELESGLDPKAQASTSSAAGLFQFIDSTWMQSLRRHGDGLPVEAMMMAGAATRSEATQGIAAYSRSELLALRLDPRIASLVAAAYAMENAATLERVLGRKASRTELYLAHFLGSGGASRFLKNWKRNPGIAAARLFPKAARSNRPIFFTRTGRARSLGEVLSHFESKIDNAVAQFADPSKDSHFGTSGALLPSYIQSIRGYALYHLLATRRVGNGLKAAQSDPQSRSSSSSNNAAQGPIEKPSQSCFISVAYGAHLQSFVNGRRPASITLKPATRSIELTSHRAAMLKTCDHIEMCYIDIMSTSTITQIRQLVESGAYTKAGIARAAGLHANTLRDASEPDWNPTAETLAKLQKFLEANDDTPVLVGAEEIIDEARNGRMYILVDDEDRENEGDLIIPAQMATPAAINFMATHGRGLICLALDKARVDQLGLDPMSRNNKESMQTAFTVSIEAKEGVTTGISAADRSRTVSVAIDATKGPDDIVTPGHVFPLMAREGGTLVRAGHTEAAVDISRLAGLNPSGVICEIMNEDGTMARLDDLIEFARKHSLKIGTIRDLIAYRMRNDHLVERVGESVFESDYGGQWRLITYRNTISDNEAYVLQKGRVIPGEPTLARVHPISVFDDILGAPGPRKRTLQRAMGAIGDRGAGVIVILTQRVGTSGEWSADEEHRNIGIGSQILADLGIEKMELLTNSRPDYVALDGYGLTITDTQPIPE